MKNMLNNYLKKILIIVFITSYSTDICTSNISFFSLIKKAFNSLTFKKPSLRINRRWIGVGALLIGGYAAWKYVSKKIYSQKKTKNLIQEIDSLGQKKIKWRKTQQETPDLSDTFNKFNNAEERFQINDVVKIIIDDDKTIQIDKETYAEIIPKPKKLANSTFNLNSLGIIRKIIADKLLIEVCLKKNNIQNFSNYFIIKKEYVQKCKLDKVPNKVPKLENGTQIKIELEPDYLKNELSANKLNETFQNTSWYKYQEDLYDENFDNQKYYIATADNLNRYNNTIDATLYLHWREKITPPPLPITINKDKALIIYDPRTNAPVVQ